MLFGNSTTEMILKYSSFMKNQKEYHEFSCIVFPKIRPIRWMCLSENDGILSHWGGWFFKTTGPPETEASSPMPAEVGSVCSGGEVFFFLNDKAPP